MTKYYIDELGNYLGGFDGAEPPEGAIEIDGPPVNGLDTFLNGQWKSYKTSNDVWNEIKAYRDLRKSSGVKVGNFWYHTDDTSRIQHLGLVMLGANIPADLLWKTMSGEFVQMHQSLALGIFQAIAFSDTQIFKIAEIHKATMMASPDPSNYNYKTGWPLVYGE
jgi:hypothetical protein